MSHIGGPSEALVKRTVGTKDNKLWRQETNLIVPCKSWDERKLSYSNLGYLQVQHLKALLDLIRGLRPVEDLGNEMSQTF